MTDTITITAPCPDCDRDSEWTGQRTTAGDGTVWANDCECREGK